MDKIEEIRQKELEVQKKQLFAQRVTAEAAVASAVAAHKQAAATEEIQRQMAADSERNRLHQMLMAEEQRLTNFRNTVLATLPLLKNEEEKKQYLTEQLLPKLKEGINVPKFSPIAVISLVADKWNSKGTLNNCLGNEARQNLKDFLSAGRVLKKQMLVWIEKSKIQEKKIKNLKKAQTKLDKIDRPFGFMDVLKIALWAILVFFILYMVFCIIISGTNDTASQHLSEDSGYLKDQSYDSVYQNAAVFFLGISIVLGAILHVWRKRHKIKTLKVKVKLLTPPDDLPLKKEKEEMEKKFKLQDEKWEVLRPQIVNVIMECNKDFINGDPRSVLLEIATAFLKSPVNKLQSFLPPSSRLPEGHYAQYFIDESDVQKFRDELTTIENDLKILLLPFYREQRIVLGNTEALIEAEQIRAFTLGNMEKFEEFRKHEVDLETKIRSLEAEGAPVCSQNKSKRTIEEIIAKHRVEIKDSKIWFAPNIPENKLLGAIRSYAKAVSLNDVLLLMDDTVWGGCANGMLITRDKLYAHSFLDSPKEISISQIKTVNIGSDKSSATKLFINDSDFASLSSIDKCNEPKICQLVTEIVLADEDKTTDDESTAPPVTSTTSQKEQQLHDEAQTQIRSLEGEEAPMRSQNKSKQAIEEIIARHRTEIKDSKIWFAPNIPENKLLAAC